jgi:hypothetical protein
VSDARNKPRTTLEQPPQPGDLQGTELVVPLKLTRWIGSGGMGEVWEARSEDLPGMRLAVKVVALEHAHDRHVVARFFGEARAAAAIDDPNILLVHGTGRTEDGRPALVMPYIEGSPLSELCNKLGPLPIDTAGQILLQIASALRAAHRRNITHRDIKGQNVMVVPNRWGREWFVILVDFGIAKFHDADLAREIHTRAKSYLGTPGYSAPEQIVGKPVDGKADIYALGVLAYCSLCGRPPYLAASGMEEMNLQLNGAPFPEPRELRPDIPPAWNDVILASLARDPALRPTAPEFARRIADGMHNGASLLATLAPRIASDAPDASELTRSRDVLTPLPPPASRPPGRRCSTWPALVTGAWPHRRPHRYVRVECSTLAALVTGACLGVISTGVAFKLVARQHDVPVAMEPRAEPPPVDAAVTAAACQVVTPETSSSRTTTRAKEPGSAGDSARPARAMCTITLRAEPSADCFLVDGGGSVSLGTAPIATRLSVAPHRVRLVNEDQHRDETVTVIIDAAKPSLVEKD